MNKVFETKAAEIALEKKKEIEALKASKYYTQNEFEAFQKKVRGLLALAIVLFFLGGLLIGFALGHSSF
jgi:hypothetical protein